MIKGHPDHIASGERERGYRAAMAEAGLAGEIRDRPGLFHIPLRAGGGRGTAERVKRPTAIFASNDDMAAAAVSVAHRRGLDVPGDLSIVGFDDTAPATKVWPD